MCRKPIFGVALLIVLLTLVLGNSDFAHAEKRYELVSAFIKARLLSDGGMEIRERRTYRFVGAFTFAFRALPLRPGVSYGEVSVREGDLLFVRNDTKAPGTFVVENSRDALTVRWYYRARNETRTFEFVYRVDGAIKRYEDAAVLYYQFIGSEWERPHGRVDLRVSAPTGLSGRDVRHWLHAPLWAESSAESDGSILAFCDNLPKRTYFELRALYPSDGFAGLPLVNQPIRQQVMREEAEWAEAANRARENALQRDEQRRVRHRLGGSLALGLGVLGLFSWISLFRSHRRPHSFQTPIRLSSDIPSDMPPAWVSYLLYSRTISSSALVATIFDLARRDYLRVSEERQKKKRLFGGEKEKTIYVLVADREVWRSRGDELLPFEREVLEFLFDTLAPDGERVSLDRLQSERSRMVSFFHRWQKSASRSAKEQKYFEPKSQRGMIRGMLFGFALLITGGVLAIFFGLGLLVVAGLGFVLIFASLAIAQRTPEGERLYRQWKGVERYLKKYHFRNVDRAGVLERIDGYFVYGVVLGVGQKVYQELAAMIPAEPRGHFVPWYAGYGGTGAPASFATAFGAMVGTLSSSTGMGGGASSGGGGGAGGGGGGAG